MAAEARGLELGPYARRLMDIWEGLVSASKSAIARSGVPPWHQVGRLVLGNEYVGNVADALGTQCRTLGELRAALDHVSTLGSGPNVLAFMKLSPKLVAEKLPSGSWRIAPGVKYQYKADEVVPADEPGVDLGKWLIYFANIALPRLAVLRALVDTQLAQVDGATPVHMYADVPWAGAALEACPNGIVIDCGSSSTKYVSSAVPKLTKIKLEDDTHLKLSAVTSAAELREYVDRVLREIDTVHATHADCGVHFFTTEVPGIYDARKENRILTAEWAEWVAALMADVPRVKAFAPLQRQQEAEFEAGTCAALLADSGISSEGLAVMTCGGGTFQLAHGGLASSHQIPPRDVLKLATREDELNGACLTVDLVVAPAK